MKKLITVLVATLVAGGLTTAALAEHKPGHPANSAKGKTSGKTNAKRPKPARVAVCHRTAGGDEAHHTIRVSDRAVPAHLRHGDTAGPCDGDGEPAGTTALASALAPVAPATTGTGSFHVDIRLLKKNARLCYTLRTTGFAPTAAHIHTLAAQDYATVADVGANGIVVPLKTPKQGLARGCTTVPREVAADLRAHPAEYYVNVHSDAFPAGHVQGPLAAAA